MVKVLLLTQDIILERMLMVTLTINGLAVMAVHSVGEVTDQLGKADFNILLMDGLFDEGAATVRGKGFQLPVLVFKETSLETLKNDIEYLSTPFDFLSLKKKMNGMLKKQFSLSEKVIENGALKIDISKQVVQIKDHFVSLSKMEFAILVSLARKTGQIVSKEKMRFDLEAQGHFFNSSIYHHIKELKRTLRDVTGEALQIKLVIGEGYQLLWE